MRHSLLLFPKRRPAALPKASPSLSVAATHRTRSQSIPAAPQCCRQNCFCPWHHRPDPPLPAQQSTPQQLPQSASRKAYDRAERAGLVDEQEQAVSVLGDRQHDRPELVVCDSKLLLVGIDLLLHAGLQLANIINKIMEGQLAVRQFLQYLRRISALANQLQLHKRCLAEAVRQIEDYIECFKQMDLDARGKITPKVLQNYLISKKYYHEPQAISRLYSKYAHEKGHLVYEDMLEALMPSADYILVSHTLTNPSEYVNRPTKFTYSCKRERLEAIHHLTAFILSEELKALDQDYSMMKSITKESQRVGAILWRLLDRNHNNSLNYQKISAAASEIGLQLHEFEWNGFLYWHFHSYKTVINREDFMRVLNVHEERKRATSACRIDQAKVENELFKRAEEERARNERIKRGVEQKLAMIPLISKAEYLNIMCEEHLPFELLNTKRELKGKKGYSNPKNLVKYVVERD